MLLQDIKAHPFFEGVDWRNLHIQTPPYAPRVEHELDTQNFERFDEDMAMVPPGMWPREVNLVLCVQLATVCCHFLFGR